MAVAQDAGAIAKSTMLGAAEATQKVLQLEDGRFVDHRWIEGRWDLSKFASAGGKMDWEAWNKARPACTGCNIMQALPLIWPGHGLQKYVLQCTSSACGNILVEAPAQVLACVDARQFMNTRSQAPAFQAMRVNSSMMRCDNQRRAHKSQSSGRHCDAQVIDAEMARRKMLEESPIPSTNEEPVFFDTAEIPWWAWVRRFHLPEVRRPSRAALKDGNATKGVGTVSTCV